MWGVVDDPRSRRTGRQPAVEGDVWAFYGVRYHSLGGHSTLVPAYCRTSPKVQSTCIDMCNTKIEFPLVSCTLSWVCACMATVCDFKTEWARHLGTALPYGAYCSIPACALRSPPVALVPHRSDAVGSPKRTGGSAGSNPGSNLPRPPEPPSRF